MVVVFAIAFVALAIALYLVVPGKIVKSTDVPKAEHRLKLQNDVRTTGIQLLAGVLLAVGAVYTARTFRLNREGQITERYTRAVDSVPIHFGGSVVLRTRKTWMAAATRRTKTTMSRVLSPPLESMPRPTQ